MEENNEPNAKNEIKKIEEYGYNEIFKRKEKQSNFENLQVEDTKTDNISIVKYKDNIFSRICNFIKRSFNRR